MITSSHRNATGAPPGLGGRYAATRGVAWLYMATLLVSVAIPTGAAIGEPLTVLVVGDMPYGNGGVNEWREIKRTLAEQVDGGTAPSLVLHLGDFQGGDAVCNREVFRQKRRDIYGLTSLPVFYTPGDNDWTDCDRNAESEPFSELKALDNLIKEFFAPGHLKPAPAKWEYASQGAVIDGVAREFPENARWLVNGVLFTTVHMVATNNGRDEIWYPEPRKTDSEVTARAIDRVVKREAAVKTWLGETRIRAGEPDVRAVVVAAQLDPFRSIEGETCGFRRDSRTDLFAWYRREINELAKALGDKPVLYVHGDTGPYTLAQNCADMNAGNLWILNAPGDFFWDAATVTIDPDDTRAPFQVRRYLGYK